MSAPTVAWLCVSPGGTKDAAASLEGMRTYENFGRDCRPLVLRDDYDTLRAQLEAAEADAANLRATRLQVVQDHSDMRARAEAAEAEIDWINAQPDDDGRMFAEIEAAAKASYRRHRSKVRCQVITRADSYESHLVWAALEWAARTKEQQA